LEITKQGKEQASSAEFGRFLRAQASEMHAERIPAEEGIARIVTIVGWVLTGHDANEPPIDAEEIVELASFVHSHVEEINAISAVHLQKWMEDDYGTPRH